MLGNCGHGGNDTQIDESSPLPIFAPHFARNLGSGNNRKRFL